MSFIDNLFKATSYLADDQGTNLTISYASNDNQFSTLERFNAFLFQEQVTILHTRTIQLGKGSVSFTYHVGDNTPIHVAEKERDPSPRLPDCEIRSSKSKVLSEMNRTVSWLAKNKLPVTYNRLVKDPEVGFTREEEWWLYSLSLFPMEMTWRCKIWPEDPDCNWTKWGLRHLNSVPSFEEDGSDLHFVTIPNAPGFLAWLPERFGSHAFKLMDDESLQYSRQRLVDVLKMLRSVIRSNPSSYPLAGTKRLFRLSNELAGAIGYDDQFAIRETGVGTMLEVCGPWVDWIGTQREWSGSALYRTLFLEFEKYDSDDEAPDGERIMAALTQWILFVRHMIKRTSERTPVPSTTPDELVPEFFDKMSMDSPTGATNGKGSLPSRTVEGLPPAVAKSYLLYKFAIDNLPEEATDRQVYDWLNGLEQWPEWFTERNFKLPKPETFGTYVSRGRSADGRQKTLGSIPMVETRSVQRIRSLDGPRSASKDQ